MKFTYADLIDLIEKGLNDNFFSLHVAVFFGKGPNERHTWFPVDAKDYLFELKLIDDPSKYEYPCYVEVESDGNIFIHPRGENKADYEA